MDEHFQQAYERAQSAIGSSDKYAATQAYTALLSAYQSLDSASKKAAYSQVTQVHQAVSAMPNVTQLPHDLVHAARMSRLEHEMPKEHHGLQPKDFIALGIFFVLIAVVLFGQPEHLGLVTHNGAPAWNGIREFSATEPFIIDLSTAFRDPDGDPLTYLVSGAPGISVHLKGSTLTVIPKQPGTYTIHAMASDESHLTKVPITVKVA